MKPNKLGIHILKEININEIIPFVDWRFFFHAWRLTGRFEGIETVCDCTACTVSWLQNFSGKDREKAEEALKLYKDARAMLKTFKDEKKVTIRAAYAIFPAHSVDEDIVVNTGNEEITIPTLRQQHLSTSEFCYSLADFIHPVEDYLGAFATTIVGGEELSDQYERNGDMYIAILIKTLADRLAEATAEWLHWKVRTDYWGYASNEQLTVDEMLKSKYSGIRPAVGYPSLPDQSIIFDMDKLLNFSAIGITLTENGAMYPNASVSGFYFAHPKSRYFMVGKIDNRQLAHYASRRGATTNEMRKWLAANL